MHPCPWGYYGDTVKPCTCSLGTVTKYQKRISGPLLDRIDIHIEVPRVEYEKLSDRRLGETSATIQERVEAARQRQRSRFTDIDDVDCNADKHPGEVRKFCALEDVGRGLIKAAMHKLNLSARAYHRVLKLARTIADLAGEEQTDPQYLAEALQYKSKGMDETWIVNGRSCIITPLIGGHYRVSNLVCEGCGSCYNEIMISIKQQIRMTQTIQVIEHSNDGMSIVEACKEVGISRSKFYYFISRHPDAITKIQEMKMIATIEQLSLLFENQIKVLKRVIQDGLSDKTKPRQRLAIYKELSRQADELKNSLQTNRIVNSDIADILTGPELVPGISRMSS
jgi:ACT domain-containing protein